MKYLYTQAEVTSSMVKLGCPSGLDAKGRFPSARVMGALSLCEAPAAAGSTAYSNFAEVGDEHLVDARWWYSFGGFQVRAERKAKGTGTFRDELKLVDPLFNMYAAIEVWREREAWDKQPGGGYNAWTTFQNQQYKAYLQDVYKPPPGVYVVVAGDNLSAIASRYAKQGKVFDWQALAYVNGLLKPWTIFIAQRLLLPWTDYTVQDGDTLSVIAANYGIGITYAELAAFNEITNPNAISVGAILRIPRASYLDYLKAKN